MEGGKLPKSRIGLRATLVGNVIFVTGGLDDDYNELTSILAWDPVAESWQPAGDLSVERCNHAIVTLPSSLVDCQL